MLGLAIKTILVFFVIFFKISFTETLKLISFAKKLYPINRSITGKGVIQTLKIIKTNHLPKLKIKKIRSGTIVYDWKIPPEWNIKNAYIEHESGRRFAEFSKNNKIQTLQPKKTSDPVFLNQLKTLKPDVCITAAYGKILSPEFLQIPSGLI